MTISATVYRFTCGHVGRDNESWHSKTRAFIRMAELRNARVEYSGKPCPDCKRG